MVGKSNNWVYGFSTHLGRLWIPTLYRNYEPRSVDVIPIYAARPEDRLDSGGYILYRHGYYIRHVCKYAGPLYYLATQITADKGFEVRKC